MVYKVIIVDVLLEANKVFFTQLAFWQEKIQNIWFFKNRYHVTLWISVKNSLLPVYPGGQQRVHSSQRAIGTAWWPPPQPAYGGWTVSAGVWVVGASEAQAGPRGCKVGCQIGRGWWLSRGSRDPGHSWLPHPRKGHYHWAVHPLPHYKDRKEMDGWLETVEGKKNLWGTTGFKYYQVSSIPKCLNKE